MTQENFHQEADLENKADQWEEQQQALREIAEAEAEAEGAYGTDWEREMSKNLYR